MSEHTDMSEAIDSLRDAIIKAFSTTAFVGRITPVDGSGDEQYSDERALQSALRERSWTEVPTSFITEYSHSLPLLTEEAFEAFLPAWLSSGLIDSSVSEALVCVFDKERGSDDAEFLDRRMRRLTSAQREVIGEVLTHYAGDTDPAVTRKDVQRCIVYLRAFAK